MKNFFLLRKLLSMVILSIIFSPYGISQEEKNHNMHHGHNHEHDMEAINQLRHLSDDPASHSVGKWDNVTPLPNGGSVGRSLGMQTVHNVLLPSGKILMTSGSSWRNLAPMEYYPEFPDPVAGKGLFDRRFDPFHISKIEGYYELVNNTAIYDPEENTFFRIHSPYPILDKENEDQFVPNDFFCTGHLQLRDGNTFFAGGTQYYFPYRTGNPMSYIFDWRKELQIDWQFVDWRQKPQDKNDPWIFSGLMKRGRWYPTLLPLLDGRMVLSSGFVGFDKGYPEMYQFEINHYVEFFDYDGFDKKTPQKAWKSIDVKNIKNSPFSTLLKYPTKIDNICYDMRHLSKLGFDLTDEDFVQPCDCPPRCAEDFKYDAFKLYGQNYLLGKNKIYLSREGDWVSLRTPKTEYMRRTMFTYWMNIEGTRTKPEITFEMGPNRKDTISSYGTSYLDPNTNFVTILGGQEASAGTLLPLGAKDKEDVNLPFGAKVSSANRFAGGLGSNKIEEFHLNEKGGEGYWTLEENFLGDHRESVRTMHYAIILPTRQILIINGGNYDFYGGVNYPILLTPIFDKDHNFVKYEKTRMAEAVQQRLYHNSAMLLPDGKIFVSGGNSGRATVRLSEKPLAYENRNGQPLPDTDAVELDIYFYRDGQMAKAQKGEDNPPIENWTAEIFSPPYLFDENGEDKKRTEILNIGTKGVKGTKFKSKIGGKDFFLFHSNKNYEIELSEKISKDVSKNDHSLVLLKLPSVTHGGQWGQHFINLSINKIDGNKLTIKTPDAMKENIPPGFYMLFYVNKDGVPSVSRMVRFDDEAKTP